MHYNGIESVARLRDVLGASVRQEVLASGDGAQVSRVLALQAAHEVLASWPARYGASPYLFCAHRNATDDEIKAQTWSR